MGEKKKKNRKMTIRGLHAGFGNEEVLHRIKLDIRTHQVTALVGPSACGKSTLLRCMNRMHETVPGAWQTGRIELDGHPIDSEDASADALRRKVGMVFQRPNPFPHLSVSENILSGLRMAGSLEKGEAADIVKTTLQQVALWEEVKDRLDVSGSQLSLGQQQRLCIGRALAMRPEVLLMDEPCSALDPVSTARIEELIEEWKESVTIVIVTHSMQQAARISDRAAFLLMGELIETSKTSKLFYSPQDPRTEDYITGRFG